MNFAVIAIVAVICLAVGWYFGYDSGFVDGFRKHELNTPNLSKKLTISR